MKTKFYIFLILFISNLSSAWADAIPSSEWTVSEQKWVNEARVLYQNQGLEFNDLQAGEEVYKMRIKAPKGVPPSEWTPFEQKMVNEMRVLYKKKDMQLTEEQERMQVQTMRETLGKMNGSTNVIQSLPDGNLNPINPRSNSTVAISNTGNVSEDNLANIIANIPISDGTVDIVGRRDGFDINGKPMLDPEGRITSYAYDVTSGDITYLVGTSRGFLIKYMRANTNTTPILIAQAARNRLGEWDVETVTGKKISGLSLSMSAFGFLLGRDTAAFRYIPGKGIINIAIPPGFLLAPIQHGDVGATGFVLLEKEDSESDAGNGKGIFNTLKSIGSTLGLNKKEDYALMHFDSGKLYPFNIDSDGKKVMKMSNCRKKNQFINECSKAMSFESLFTRDGTPNMSHYYWRVDWYKTPSGPIAITMENGMQDIYITNLTSGKKVVGFSRALGIQSFKTNRLPNGHLSIIANWAFTQHEISDVEKHLEDSPDISHGNKAD